MKTVRKKNLAKIKINNLSSRCQFDSEVTHIYDVVKTFVPDAEIVYQVWCNDDNSWTIERALVAIFRNNIVFHVWKYRYPRRHYEISPDFSLLENIDRSAIDHAKRGIEPPQNIGVFTLKKIEDWINFGTLVFLKLQKQNAENHEKIRAFKQTVLSDPDSIWENANEGYIDRNGIRFTFEIRKTGISNEIRLNLTWENKNYETFCRLADNKYDHK